MGIAFAIGAIVGTQAISQPALLVVLLVSLTLVIATITSTTRRIAVAILIGAVSGAAAGYVRQPQPAPAISHPPRLIMALIESDPKVERFGTNAWVTWLDRDGIERRSFARFPSAPELGRGDRIEAFVIPEGLVADMLHVSRHRVVEHPQGPERIRRSVRSWLTSTSSNRIPGSPGTLTLGLLIGDDSALPIDERLALRRSGLSHITAVSGWNVTLVTGSIGAVFLALRLRGWFWVLVQLLLMGTYVWIVGLEPPVTRAALMAIVALAAARLGRPSHSITGLALAAALMVMHSPEILISLSFQLSVLATLALITAMRLSNVLSGWQKALAAPALASGMTGLATAPVLAATFGSLSLATVPANIAAGPIVPLASIGGVLTAMFSAAPPIAAILGWLVWLLCALILAIATLGSSLPYGYLEFAPLEGATTAIVHLLVFGAIASTTPEGRLLRRRLVDWTQSEPRAATAAGAGMAATLVTLLVVL